ncbi:MAG TPA: helix-turn-helix domain-containing protein [Flavipsychrobacter sp.]|nr:helix-turn-helix domain-containing protein [Flavipsychrobacter sp.]
MLFRQFQPSKALSAYVKCYWILECEYYPGPPERILPDGCTELIFHYGDSYSRVSGKGLEEQAKTLLVGQIKRAIELQANGRTGMMGVRFYPWGLHALMGIPVSELTGQHIDARLIFKQLSELEEQVNNCGHEGMIQSTEDFLLKILKHQKQKHFNQADRFAAIIKHISGTDDNAVGVMAASANMSVRQFNRKFNEVTGLSPKHYLRITRMQEFISQYRQSGDAKSLSSVIYDCGYYDPAHFSHDFKDIAGVKPSEYFEGLQDLGSAMLL